jgi:hypothetical protein
MAMTRRTKVIVGVLTSILVLGAAYFIWLKSSDTSTYYEYATYGDLKRDGTSAAAAVPEFVPPSATNIWGWYDVDFDVGALEFEFARPDYSSIAKSFRQAIGEQRSVVEAKVRSYKWKHELPSDLELEAFSGQREGTEYLILDRKNSRAHYLSESGG